MSKIQDAYQIQLCREAEQLRAEAERLPHGRARDAMLQRLTRLELTAKIQGWLTSAELEGQQGMTRPHL
ncbi:hypothetical protein [Bradyrhizobium sp. SYSU BS000235]|uniref:hypothetical protein n=1 Tax=Bradyrhizobium sp. SYSU BS000235 TaxID=3411332 RepID=UPI003C742D91